MGALKKDNVVTMLLGSGLEMQYFVNDDDSVPGKVMVHKDSPRGIHFRRAGPHQKVYFSSDEVHACIVTCGGLCPGLNTVIREIVCALYYMIRIALVVGWPPIRSFRKNRATGCASKLSV
ncbi:hypothetical protein AgCh_025027 [Apium graveolens]